MRQEELDGVERLLAPSALSLLQAIREFGTATGPMLSPGGGIRRELKPLLDMGLIREVGKRQIGDRPPAMAYEAVPVEEITVRGPGRPPKSRYLEPGDWTKWFAIRKRVIELTNALRTISPMAFWQAAPPDDRTRVLAEVLALREWADEVVDEFTARQEDDRLRAKIDQMRATNGRTVHETDTAHRLANKLEAKLVRKA